MTKSVTVILDELAGGLQALRAALAGQAVRRTPATVPNETDDLKKILTSMERQVIERVMRKVRGNQSRGAQLLNISRGALIAKLKHYGIENFRYLKNVDRRRRGLADARSPKATTSILPTGVRRKPKRHMTPKLKALRVLQGRYLGALRGLSLRQRDQIKRLRSQKGFDVAIKAAGRLK